MTMRPTAVPLFVLAVFISGCAGPGEGDDGGDDGDATTTPPPSTPPRYGHEHSVFRMFIAGENVSFHDARFDFLATRHPPAHLHLSGPEETDAQYVIHAEGELGFTLGEFFGTLDVRVEADQIVLDAAVHEGRVVADNATHAWQLWVDGCADPVDSWVLGDLIAPYAPAEHDRILITFAPRGAVVADLAGEMATVPSESQLDAELGDTCVAT